MQYLNLNVGQSSNSCLDRAQQFWEWCGNELYEPIVVTFTPTGEIFSFPPEDVVLDALGQQNQLEGIRDPYTIEGTSEPFPVESAESETSPRTNSRPEEILDGADPNDPAFSEIVNQNNSKAPTDSTQSVKTAEPDTSSHHPITVHDESLPNSKRLVFTTLLVSAVAVALLTTANRIVSLLHGVRAGLVALLQAVERRRRIRRLDWSLPERQQVLRRRGDDFRRLDRVGVSFSGAIAVRGAESGVPAGGRAWAVPARHGAEAVRALVQKLGRGNVFVLAETADDGEAEQAAAWLGAGGFYERTGVLAGPAHTLMLDAADLPAQARTDAPDRRPAPPRHLPAPWMSTRLPAGGGGGRKAGADVPGDVQQVSEGKGEGGPPSKRGLGQRPSAAKPRFESPAHPRLGSSDDHVSDDHISDQSTRQQRGLAGQGTPPATLAPAPSAPPPAP